MGFWGEINKPDDFRNDWYGELTNQISHKWLGEHASIWLVFGYAAYVGEIPHKWAVWGALTIGYLAIEAGVQGWKRGDSWFDVLMFSTWASALLLVFDAFSIRMDTRHIGPWEVQMPIANLDANIFAYFAVFAFSWACLLPRIRRRM